MSWVVWRVRGDFNTLDDTDQMNAFCAAALRNGDRVRVVEGDEYEADGVVLGCLDVRPGGCRMLVKVDRSSFTEVAA